MHGHYITNCYNFYINRRKPSSPKERRRVRKTPSPPKEKFERYNCVCFYVQALALK